MNNCCECKNFNTSPFDYPCAKCKNDSHFESINISKKNAIDILEKIKTEILDFLGGMNMCNELDNETFKKLDIRIDGIFDERIDELKGEDK